MKVRLSLRIQLLCVIAAVVIVAVIITGALMYSQLTSVMEDQICENLKNVMNENGININNTFNYLYRAEKLLNTNDYFKLLLTNESSDVIKNNSRILDLQNELKSTYGLIIDDNRDAYLMSFIVNSTLPAFENLSKFRWDSFAEKYNGIYSDEYVKNEKWYIDIISNSSIPKIFYSESNNNYIYFANVIRDVSDYKDSVLGVVIVGVNLNRILENITYMGAKDALQMAIIDRSGHIAASSGKSINEDNISELLAEKKEYDGNIVMVSNLDYGLRLVAMLNKRVASIRIHEVGNYFLLSIVLVLTAVLITSVIISGSMTRPIRELSDAMKNINENRDIQIKTKLPSNKEIISLYQSYNKMMFRISQLLDEAKLAGMREEEMKMKMLQAQIKPHFLYNALDSISMVALMHGENEISEMITALSDSFRYSISDTDNFIALGDEINFIHNYVKFQEWRYEEKIFLEVDISEKDRKTAIPKFILQPLVENSIIHGMGDESRALHINITAENTENDFVIYVTDDGVGCNSGDLNRHISKGGSGVGQLKFGLINVNERIKLKFGEEYGLSYYNTPDGKLTAKITIPAADNSMKGNEL